MHPLHRHRVDLQSLPTDGAMFLRIVDDLRRNAGQHAPADVWADAGGGASTSDASHFTAENLLHPWLGHGAKKANKEAVFWYYDYLRAVDQLGIMDRDFPSPTAIPNLLIADLGSVIDVNLAAAFAHPAGDKLRVIEVGGGYGRLAEVFANVYPRGISWLLVDAVPASLLYAYEYLTRSNPELKVGSFYRDDPYDLDRFDVYIAPTWHVKPAPGTFDLAINVQSMQEMEQRHVDHYLEMFDDSLRDDGVVYLCNRRDHVFRGTYNYPAHWECLLKTRTPRSFLRDMPAELYRKSRGDFAPANALRDAFYRRSAESFGVGLKSQAVELGYKAY